MPNTPASVILQLWQQLEEGAASISPKGPKILGAAAIQLWCNEMQELATTVESTFLSMSIHDPHLLETSKGPEMIGRHTTQDSV